MKYLVFEVHHEHVITEVPVIFPKLMVHAMMAQFLNVALSRHYPNCAIKPISAGEVIWQRSSLGDLVTCSGHSETMKLVSRGDRDSALISGIDYSAGISTEVMRTAAMLRMFKPSRKVKANATPKV